MALETSNQQMVNTANLRSFMSQYGGLNGLPEWYWQTMLHQPLNADQRDAFMQNALSMYESEKSYLRSLPEEQIQHLINTGMSRSAAMQMLSGGEYQPAPIASAGNVEQTALNQAQFGLQLGTTALSIGGFAINAGLSAANLSVQQAMASEQIEASRQGRAVRQSYLDANSNVGRVLQAMDNWHQRTGEEYASSLGEQIEKMKSCSYDEMPDVAKVCEDYNQMLENPEFYPRMREMYRHIYMDKDELVTEHQNMIAFADIQKWNLQDLAAMCYLHQSQARVQTETEDYQKGIYSQQYLQSVAQTKIANSQATIEQNSAKLSSFDTNFWLQFDGKNRALYMDGMTQSQAYDAALKGLNVDNLEMINESTFYDLFEKCQIYSQFGPEYFKLKAKNLMQNEEYRNAALWCLKYDSNTYKNQLINTDNAVPMSDQWFGQKAHRVATFFKKSGAGDYAIKGAALSAGFIK